MRKVQSILQRKGSQVHTISETISVYAALEEMMSKNVSALVVVEGDSLKGIFTERDYARKIVLQGKSSKVTAIGEVMSVSPITVCEEDTVEYCMGLMTNRHVRHLPVVANNKLMGIISIGDIVKEIIEEQQETIKHLENYISG